MLLSKATYNKCIVPRGYKPRTTRIFKNKAKLHSAISKFHLSTKSLVSKIVSILFLYSRCGRKRYVVSLQQKMCKLSDVRMSMGS